jgi:hypothetical protein
MLVNEEITGTLTPESLKYSMKEYPKVPTRRINTVSGLLIAAIEGLRAIRKWIDFLRISVFNSLISLTAPPRAVKTGIDVKLKTFVLSMP